jgi:hypothetical protein
MHAELLSLHPRKIRVAKGNNCCNINLTESHGGEPFMLGIPHLTIKNTLSVLQLATSPD